MKRVRQFLAVVSLIWLSWLVMMLLHECGHVLGAWWSGGTVTQVVWYPLRFSQTNVHPNPHPAMVVWAGPIIGSALPVVLAGVLQRFAKRAAFAAWFVAGTCLLINGLYIGVGTAFPAGDTQVMHDLNVPGWVMAVFGLPVSICGLALLNIASQDVGFGTKPRFPTWRNVVALMSVASAITVAALLVNAR